MLDLGLLRHFITGFPSLCNSSLLFDIHVKKGNAFFGGEIKALFGVCHKQRGCANLHQV